MIWSDFFDYGAGDVIHYAPTIYQERDGRQYRVDGKSVLKGKNLIGFEVADYDLTRPLFIDPGLVYSTYLGGAGGYSRGASASAIAIDSSRNAYVTGQTGSASFPTAPGSFQATRPGPSGNAFVTKLNPPGTGLSRAR